MELVRRGLRLRKTGALLHEQLHVPAGLDISIMHVQHYPTGAGTWDVMWEGYPLWKHIHPLRIAPKLRLMSAAVGVQFTRMPPWLKRTTTTA